MNITSKHILTLCSFVWLAGCTTTKAPEPTPDAPLRPDEAVIAADTLYEQGRMQEAIAATIDISRKRPDAVGLAALKQRIAAQLSEERRKEVVMRAESAAELDVADAKRFGLPIESYRLQKNVVGENAPLRSALTKMQEALASPVSMHLVNADINAIIAQIGQSQNINIVADSEISEKALTIHAEDTPLIEILDYVGRNLNVEFSVGTSLIWVTPKEEVTTGVPLMTRVYKLRKGLIGSELGKTSGGKSLFKGPEERGRSSSSSNNDKGGEEKEGAIGLLDLIDRFVPQPEGADFIFNDKAHSLIVKNTRENLAQVEELIAAMDIRPLQILIEARFITTKVNDLRELGIEWLLQRPYDFGGSEGGGGDTVAQLKRMQAAATSPEEILKIGDSIQNLSPNQFTKNAYVAKAGEAGFGGMYQTLLGETGLQATLHALQQTGNSRTVVVPRVTTLNNREATFRFGRDVSYFEEVDTNIMTSGGGINSGESRDNVTYNYNRPTVVEVGYSLTVTPSVGADLSTINLVLRPEISNIEEWKRYRLSSLDSGKDIGDEPAIEIPTIARQYIETEAVVRSGETVVLGGLVDTLKTETSSGTPWLSKLPFIGQLFKVDKNNETANNMLIFVTATLISDMGEELIPLNERDRYGLAISADAATPNVLKGALPMRLEEFMNNAQSPAQEETPIEPTPADAPAAVPAEAAAAAMPAEAPAAPPVQPVAPPVNIAAPVEE